MTALATDPACELAGATRGYRLFDPAGSGLPPVVMLHGLRTDPERFFEAFLGAAERHRQPMAVPDCTMPEWRGYQRLGTRTAPLRAARSLGEVVHDLLTDSSRDSPRIDLFGYSAGAQCAHRYALLYPNRVRRLVLSSAGWYTDLALRTPFPLGIGPSPRTGWRRVDVEGFLAIPVHVLVGEYDVVRDAALRTGGDLDLRQGAHRLARAVRWVEAVRAEASRRRMECLVTLELLPSATHSFGSAIRAGGLAERMFGFLAGEGEAPCGGMLR